MVQSALAILNAHEGEFDEDRIYWSAIVELTASMQQPSRRHLFNHDFRLKIYFQVEAKLRLLQEKVEEKLQLLQAREWLRKNAAPVA